MISVLFSDLGFSQIGTDCFHRLTQISPQWAKHQSRIPGLGCGFDVYQKVKATDKIWLNAKNEKSQIILLGEC
jgi:hypothetical protein